MYDHGIREVHVKDDASLASTGIIGTWAPGLVPHIVRAAAIVVSNTVGAAGVVKLMYGDAGLATTQGTEIDAINLATTHAAGEAVYVEGLDQEVVPGEEVIFDMTDAAASGDTGHLILLVEPRWERPANNDNMVEST